MTSMQHIQREAQKVAYKVPEFASILIVDDQRFDRARLRRMCAKLEFDTNVFEADSLESLGTAMELDAYDLIFLDYHLTDGNGLQALDAIQYDPRNRNAATIMVTGDDQAEIAINAMKNGCSDFLVKDDLSDEAVRRASINALQKAGLNQSLETQEVMRNRIEFVLDRFTKECTDELKPMLSKMMRHVRDLRSARLDEQQHDLAVTQITNSCARLFDFMSDIEDQERKSFALADIGDDLTKPAPPEDTAASRHKLFGRQPYRA